MSVVVFKVLSDTLPSFHLSFLITLFHLFVCLDLILLLVFVLLTPSGKMAERQKWTEEDKESKKKRPKDFTVLLKLFPVES